MRVAIGPLHLTVGYEMKMRSTAFPPEPDDADDYMEEVAYSDRGQSKGKIEEMLKQYTRWLSQQYGTDEWELNFTFESGRNSAPRELPLSPNQKIGPILMDYQSLMFLWRAPVNRHTAVDSIVIANASCCEPRRSGRSRGTGRTRFAHARRCRACA